MECVEPEIFGRTIALPIALESWVSATSTVNAVLETKNSRFHSHFVPRDPAALLRLLMTAATHFAVSDICDRFYDWSTGALLRDPKSTVIWIKERTCLENLDKRNKPIAKWMMKSQVSPHCVHGLHLKSIVGWDNIYLDDEFSQRANAQMDVDFAPVFVCKFRRFAFSIELGKSKMVEVHVDFMPTSSGGLTTWYSVATVRFEGGNDQKLTLEALRTKLGEEVNQVIVQNAYPHSKIIEFIRYNKPELYYKLLQRRVIGVPVGQIPLVANDSRVTLDGRCYQTTGQLVLSDLDALELEDIVEEETEKKTDFSDFPKAKDNPHITAIFQEIFPKKTS